MDYKGNSLNQVRNPYARQHIWGTIHLLIIYWTKNTYWHEGPMGPGALGPKIMKINCFENMKKTRVETLCMGHCLSAPHHLYGRVLEHKR